MINLPKLAWVLGQQEQRRCEEHQNVERWDRCDHGSILLVVLEVADCVQHPIVVKAELHLGKTHVSLSKDRNDKV